MLEIAKMHSHRQLSDVDIVYIDKTVAGFKVIDEDSGEILITCTKEYKEMVMLIVKYFNWEVCNGCRHEYSDNESEATFKDEDISYKIRLNA